MPEYCCIAVSDALSSSIPLEALARAGVALQSSCLCLVTAALSGQKCFPWKTSLPRRGQEVEVSPCGGKPVTANGADFKIKALFSRFVSEICHLYKWGNRKQNEAIFHVAHVITL